MAASNSAWRKFSSKYTKLATDSDEGDAEARLRMINEVAEWVIANLQPDEIENLRHKLDQSNGIAADSRLRFPHANRLRGNSQGRIFPHANRLQR